MKKTSLALLVLLATSIAIFQSCKKDNDDVVDVESLKKDILNNAANNVCQASYTDMSAKSNTLLTAITTLVATTNDANLNACRTAWKDTRNTWERSEAWLFGPVEADNIDPRIDTWPVDFNALETILSGSDALTEAYVDGLDDALKGFHPIEYLLWGQNGTKTAASFTTREKQYLLALAQNLNKLCGEVKDSWTGGYTGQLAAAGSGSTEYPTKLAAFLEIAEAMSGICDEVANSKMNDPFVAQDASKEESPFAKNSITDFTNNINGILNMYQGKFTSDGNGIEDLVRYYNLSLDNEIKTKHAAAVAALQTITVPYGQAIFTQQTQVQNAMAKINDLAVTLDTKLKPFLQQYGQ